MMLRTASNNKVREFLDRMVSGMKPGDEKTPDCICSLVNKDDRRRRYEIGAITMLLRERDDIERTETGWRKKEVNTHGPATPAERAIA